MKGLVPRDLKPNPQYMSVQMILRGGRASRQRIAHAPSTSVSFELRPVGSSLANVWHTEELGK